MRFPNISILSKKGIALNKTNTTIAQNGGRKPCTKGRNPFTANTIKAEAK